MNKDVTATGFTENVYSSFSRAKQVTTSELFDFRDYPVPNCKTPFKTFITKHSDVPKNKNFHVNCHARSTGCECEGK